MQKKLLGHNQKIERGFFKKFKRDNKGTTAIEFAILGIPFVALLFGIIELAVLFFVQSTTQHALETVSREIRTGEFQAVSDNAQDFEDKICAAMSGVGNCDNLRVDIVSSGTGKFKGLVLPASPVAPPPGETEAEKEIRENAPPAMPASTYASTAGGDVVIVRVQYVHQLAVPSALTKLSNASGNTHVISVTTAFKNEPF